MDLKYYAPSTLTEALDYLQQNDAVKIIAGGTDLLVKHYENLDLLGNLMHIGKLAELKNIKTGADVEIGALVSHYQLESDPWLQEHVPFLSEAASQVGAAQIRHRGTVGGNIGNASPAADSVPPLIALDAVVELASAEGRREMPLAEFFTGPGQSKRTGSELITGVRFMSPQANTGTSFIKIGKRKAMAIATASIAVFVTLADGHLADIRICLGSVAPVPYRALQTEAVLRGQDLSALPLDSARDTLSKEINPIDDIRGTASYRLESAGAILVRALKQAINEAGGEN